MTKSENSGFRRGGKLNPVSMVGKILAEITEDQRPRHENVRIEIMIGIDPGVNTGFAVWDAVKREFVTIGTGSFWEAIRELDKYSNPMPRPGARHAAVYIEAPQMNRPTFGGGYHNGANGVRTREKVSRNVGMNIRDSQLIMEYCAMIGLLYFPIKPGKYTKTKLKSDDFRSITGENRRISEHARDAAMMVFDKRPFKMPIIVFPEPKDAP